jgi:hypothetical protein
MFGPPRWNVTPSPSWQPVGELKEVKSGKSYSRRSADRRGDPDRACAAASWAPSGRGPHPATQLNESCASHQKSASDDRYGSWPFSNSEWLNPVEQFPLRPRMTRSGARRGPVFDSAGGHDSSPFTFHSSFRTAWVKSWSGSSAPTASAAPPAADRNFCNAKCFSCVPQADHVTI